MKDTFVRTKTRKGFEDCTWFSEGYTFRGYVFPEWGQVQEDVDGTFRIHSLNSVKAYRESLK